MDPMSRRRSKTRRLLHRCPRPGSPRRMLLERRTLDSLSRPRCWPLYLESRMHSTSERPKDHDMKVCVKISVFFLTLKSLIWTSQPIWHLKFIFSNGVYFDIFITFSLNEVYRALIAWSLNFYLKDTSMTKSIWLKPHSENHVVFIKTVWLNLIWVFQCLYIIL